MEKKMEKKMENEMETGIIGQLIGIRGAAQGPGMHTEVLPNLQLARHGTCLHLERYIT